MNKSGRRNAGLLAMSGGAVLLAYVLGGTTAGKAAAMGAVAGGGFVALFMVLPYVLLERSRAKQARARLAAAAKPPAAQ
jgi:hypothetical protein